MAGHGSLGGFVHQLPRGAVGCLRGTFHDSLTIRRRDVRLTSAPGSRATIDGVLYVAKTARDVVVAGLVLRSDRTPNVRINGTRFTIRDSEITNDHTGICVSVGGAFEHWGIAHEVALLRNRIHDCGRLPPTNHDHGIYVEGAVGTVIRGNLIYENADRGIQFYPDAKNSVVTNNVIDGNGEGVIFSSEAGGGEYSAPYTSSDNLVARNIISNSRVRHNVEAFWAGPVGTGNVLRDNCLWNGAQGDLDLSAGGFVASDNLVADPEFVDREAGDFSLKPGSPCAGMGPH